MSSVTDKTTYRLTISGLDSGALQHQFTTDDGWNDTFALALVTALNTLSWPPNAGFTVEKLVSSVTDYTANPGVTPPVFA